MSNEQLKNLERMAESAAIQIGLRLPIETRPFYAAGFEPLRAISAYLAGRICQAIGVDEMPAAAKRFIVWYDARHANDAEWCREIEAELKELGVLEIAMAGAAAATELRLVLASLVAPAPAYVN